MGDRCLVPQNSVGILLSPSRIMLPLSLVGEINWEGPWNNFQNSYWAMKYLIIWSPGLWIFFSRKLIKFSGLLSYMLNEGSLICTCEQLQYSSPFTCYNNIYCFKTIYVVKLLHIFNGILLQTCQQIYSIWCPNKINHLKRKKK